MRTSYRKLQPEFSWFHALLPMVLLCFIGCKGKGHAEVQNVLIPQADAYYPAPADGVELVVPNDIKEQPPLPTAKHIKLAIGRKVQWSFVATLLDRLDEAEKLVTVIAGNRHKVYAMKLDDGVKTKAAIEVTATEDGKACVQLPRAPMAKCTQSPDGRYVPRTGVRQVVREAMKAMKIYDVIVLASPTLHWADVVRALDGARTCCGPDTMRVSLYRGKQK